MKPMMQCFAEMIDELNDLRKRIDAAEEVIREQMARGVPNLNNAQPGDQFETRIGTPAFFLGRLDNDSKYRNALAVMDSDGLWNVEEYMDNGRFFYASTDDRDLAGSPVGRVE